MNQGVHLYRALLRSLRQADALPAPLKSKAAFNVRQLFDFYRNRADPTTAESLLEDGRAALRLLQWLRTLPQVCGPGIRGGQASRRPGRRPPGPATHPPPTAAPPLSLPPAAPPPAPPHPRTDATPTPLQEHAAELFKHYK